MLVLSVIAVVVSINTATSLLTSHAVSLYAAATWENGKDYLQAIQVGKDGKVNLPTPVRFEHTFEGWYRDPDHNLPFNPATDRIKRNTTLHARFTPNQYTITLINPKNFRNPDGTINPDSILYTETQSLGWEFIFPRIPGITDHPEFKGWSLSMDYNHYLNFNFPDGDQRQSQLTNIIAQPGTRYTNFFRQNATYWAAWSEDYWKSRDTTNYLSESVSITFIDYNAPTDMKDFAADFTFRNGTQPILSPIEFAEYGQDTPPFYSPLPLTMPSMFFLVNGQLTYFTALNDGMKSYTFGGWHIQNDPLERIFRDGEAINLITLEDLLQGTPGDRSLTFYAVWIETTN